MEKVFTWVKKHKVAFGVLVFLLFGMPLFLVHILFKFDSSVSLLTAEWSAGDVLAYIAGFEAFIGTVSLGALALWQNQQINKQHLESMAPAFSMSLISVKGLLFLTIENTGENAAKEIKISVESIENNGENCELKLDDLFASTFELYPKETVQGFIAFSGENMCTRTFPQVTVNVSYFWPQLNRHETYKRKVIYNNGYKQNVNADISMDNREMESAVNNISRASIRVANYLDGCNVAPFDESNILAKTSLRNDMVEALGAREDTSG